MNDDFITLTDAARLLPGRGGKNMCVASIVRRIVNGFRGVKLQAIRNGGMWFTKREWVEQFIANCTAKATGVRPVSMTGVNSSSHRRAVAALAGRYGIHVGKHVDRRGRTVHDGQSQNEATMRESGSPEGPLLHLLPKRVARGPRRKHDLGET